MRAVVVYESMYGNTHVVAASIADGLRDAAGYEVTVVPVAEATGKLAGTADLLVVGGPTHMHGLSTAVSRRQAVQAAAKQGPTLDPDATGQGIRDWLKEIGAGSGPAAAFDTRLSGVPAFTGRASRGIGKLLKRHGYRLVAGPESFLVSQQNTLLDGEAARARQWGAILGAAASKAFSPARA
jgi:Flavodoxin